MVVDLSKIYIVNFVNTDFANVAVQFKVWKSENPSYKIWAVNDWYDSHNHLCIKTVYVII